MPSTIDLVSVALLLTGLSPLSAQQAAPLVVAAGSEAKRATATRVTTGAIHLDGRLDDAAWGRATPLTDFVMKEPTEGGTPTDRLEVRFVYDDDALYVGARIRKATSAAIQAPIARRDNIGQSEHLLISLDTYHDRRTAYTFGVTASGVRGDWYHGTDNETEIDASFDPVWEARTALVTDGWTAEYRIPFSQLRFNAGDVQEWGLNVDHWIPARNEDVFWIPVPKNVTAWSSRMGTLGGITGIRPTRRLELLPYVASDATLTGDRDRADPFDDGRNLRARVGGDLKVGLGPSLTLAATINPDFGQVEADPAQINLSAFETIFPERRPFFIEGGELLRGTGTNFFYSRRVGAQPRGGASGDFVDRPDNTTILGAAKITGRLPSKTSIGALAALTNREYARTFTGRRIEGSGPLADTIPRRFDDTLVTPLAGYAVVRAQQEFGRNASTAGAILTAVHRDLSPGEPLASLLTRDAWSGGVDWNARFAGGAYALYGNTGFSHVRGDSTVLLRLQRSSARYYQRPDADYIGVNPHRTSLTGTNGALGLDRVSGTHWLWSLYGGWESPGLELNDAGRLGSGDGKQGFAQFTYRETTPNRFLHAWSVTGGSENEWDFGNERQFGALRSDASLTFRNFWTLDLTAWNDLRSQNHSETRGGPYMQTPQSRVAIARLGSSFARATRWNVRAYYGKDENGGLTNRLSGGLSFRPTPRWQLSIDPNYLRVTNPRQYVATDAGTGPAATFDNRYIFSFIDQSEFRLPLRLNFTVKPDLTLELYGEPFAASGEYERFGELVAARSGALDTYDAASVRRDENGRRLLVVGGDTVATSCSITCFDDFSVRSLRSNMVLRWEWRRGSTFFVVWQQSREAELDRVRLVNPRDVFGAFTATGTNFFAVKMNWWLPVL